MYNNNDNQILACIDGSRFTSSVCDYAAWISLKTNAPLKLLHNLEQPRDPAIKDLSGTMVPGIRSSLLEELTEIEERRNRLKMEEGKILLESARERVVQAGVESPILKQRHGDLIESLIDCEHEIRVLVLGIRGEEHAIDDQHLGAHLESTIRSLHRPILVVNSDYKEPKQVMLAYDGSKASSKGLDMLAQSPLFKGIPIHLVTVGEDADNAVKIQSEAKTKLTEAGHNVTAVILHGRPGDELCRYQEEHDIDLTLMGAFSHVRLRELVLGSLTIKMLLGSRRPLLLLR